MEFLGGIRYGKNYLLSFGTIWPFAKLVVDTNRLSLQVWTQLRTFYFPKEQIKKLSVSSRWFLVRMQIEHNIEEYPPYIVFSTFNIEAIKAALRANHYIL